ncbi:CU044_2847 family protein [Streptomyces plumbiresistens]|uniref:Trypsin-co-occurring domain-containing protein n=1 Tax=Streptomyces plumbiresistens TaxID=511811 RepID=A0ABP7R0K6_9ACTN
MERLVEFETADGAVVSVEAFEERSGSRLVSRGDGTVQAARTFEGALEGVRAAASSALRVFREGSLRPDGIEIEFGVKLSAETGAIIAKGTAEGHLVVKLSWSPGAAPETDVSSTSSSSLSAPSSAPSSSSSSVPEPSPSS